MHTIIRSGCPPIDLDEVVMPDGTKARSLRQPDLFGYLHRLEVPGIRPDAGVDSLVETYAYWQQGAK
jgi:hypothetical protein